MNEKMEKLAKEAMEQVTAMRSENNAHVDEVMETIKAQFGEHFCVAAAMIMSNFDWSMELLKVVNVFVPDGLDKTVSEKIMEGHGDMAAVLICLAGSATYPLASVAEIAEKCTSIKSLIEPLQERLMRSRLREREVLDRVSKQMGGDDAQPRS